MTKLDPIHPGEILLEDFMTPLGVSINQLARDIDVPPNRISMIVSGARSITADTALRLGAYFGVAPETWFGLQLDHDLRVPPPRISEIVKGRREISADTALRLGRHFDTSPEFWINLQTKFDLRSAMEVVLPELRLVRARRVAA